MEESRIFKYELLLTDKQEILLPKYATILKVGVQGVSIYVWCRVTPSRPLVPITFYIIGTGRPLPLKPIDYLDTVFQGNFVWHIYIGDSDGN